MDHLAGKRVAIFASDALRIALAFVEAGKPIDAPPRKEAST